MFKSIKAAILISLALTGCAGTNFVRPAPDAFKLGNSTYAQVTQQLGEPNRTGTTLKNDKNVKNIIYAYAATGGEPLEAGVIPARAMSYYFLDDTLIGQEFVSSFKSDNTDFDDTKIGSIVKGKTTRAEVTALLGKATALYIAPMVKTSNGEAVGYNYSTTKGGVFSGFKFFKKTVLISFDASGLVSDIDFSSSGSK